MFHFNSMMYKISSEFLMLQKDSSEIIAGTGKGVGG